MFEICISPNENEFINQIFDFQFFKKNENTFRITVDLSGFNED